MEYKARQKGYEVLGVLRPDEVLPHTGPKASMKSFFGYEVKMSSLRYQTFKRSLMCECCSLYGTVMLLELPKDHSMPHFNLYAEREGKLVQMTKDHIQPKSKGGKDHIGNMQTLCCRCNELRGDYATKMKRLREIQDGVPTVYMVFHGYFQIDGFATSDEGLAEIVRKHIVDFYKWNEDTFEIQVSIQEKLITVQSDIGEPAMFIIRPIRRV